MRRSPLGSRREGVVALKPKREALHCVKDKYFIQHISGIKHKHLARAAYSLQIGVGGVCTITILLASETPYVPSFHLIVPEHIFPMHHIGTTTRKAPQMQLSGMRCFGVPKTGSLDVAGHGSLESAERHIKHCKRQYFVHLLQSD